MEGLLRPVLFGAFLFLLILIPIGFIAKSVTSTDWAKTTASDVEAAYRLLRDNHPGAIRELGDTGFIDRLAKGRATALEEAGHAATRDDYARVMTRFASGLDDGHIAWKPAVPPTAWLTARMGRRARGGHSLHVRDGALWISLPSLTPEAEPILAFLAKAPEQIKAADMIVFDLRGNQGGDSGIGDRFIGLIFGPDAVSAIQHARPDCPMLWRASPGNLRFVRTIQRQLPAQRRPERDELGAEAHALQAAIQAGKPFVSHPSPACLAVDKPVERPHVASSAHQPLVVLTDRACFSSCLIFLERLKSLGAVQMGSRTNVGNWYMEVRFEALPSRNGSFSTLQKVDLAQSRQIGPFLPDIEIDPATTLSANYLKARLRDLGTD